MALAQMVGTEDDGVFTNYQQPSEFCANFHQVRPAARDTRKLSLTPEAAFGCQAAVVVPAHGDLLLGATLEVKLQKMPNEFPVSRAAYYPVEALARRVSITVGGCVLDTHTSDFFRIYDEHVRTPGESQNYRRLANFDPVTLTSAVPCTERLYLPLVFSFFRSRKSALPLAALRDTEVRLTFDFATAEEVGVNAGTLEAALYVDYGLVDEGVRARLTRQPIDILFEQVQWNGGQLVPPAGDSHSVRIVTKLGFRRQVKAVWWLLKETEAHDPTRTQHGRYFGDWQNTYLSLQPSQLDFGGYNLLQSISEKLAPVAWARILFDGQERFPARRSHLFNMLQAAAVLRPGAAAGHLLPRLHGRRRLSAAAARPVQLLALPGSPAAAAAEEEHRRRNYGRRCLRRRQRRGLRAQHPGPAQPARVRLELQRAGHPRRPGPAVLDLTMWSEVPTNHT